jgi:hypothetical protein
MRQHKEHHLRYTQQKREPEKKLKRSQRWEENQENAVLGAEVKGIPEQGSRQRLQVVLQRSPLN